MRVERLRGQPPSGQAHIYTINYEQLQNLETLDFCDLVVFDEITRAKNPSSERIKAVRPMLKAHRRWGLTGTPRPNSLLELFAQIRLLDNGQRLSPSFSQFRQTYFHPIDYNEYNWEPNPGAEETIYRKIHDITITLRSSDYLGIPDTITEDLPVALPDAARALYRELERELLLCLDGEEVVADSAAILVNKLLQVSGGAVYSTDRKCVEIHAGKTMALKRLLANIQGERAIIAANYIHERNRICKAVPGAVDAAMLKGDVEKEWNSGKIRYLVADPRSLGHGLNLQGGGHTVVWFSPTWSRELYDQFNARVARKGQKEVTTIYRIICSGTMDDCVVAALHEKGLGQSAMLQVLTNFRKQGLTFK